MAQFLRVGDQEFLNLDYAVKVRVTDDRRLVIKLANGEEVLLDGDQRLHAFKVIESLTVGEDT